MRFLLNRIHQILGGIRPIALLAAKLRNQMECIIGARMADSCNSEHNGEFRLLDCLGAEIRTFVDVGANRGRWSQRLLNTTGATGYLYEPSSQCAQFLRQNFSDANITIKEVAICDTSGTADFFEENNFGETSSMVGIQQKSSGALKRIRVSTLDEEFPECCEKVDILKVDCEGLDLKALFGAKKLLHRVRFVQFEYSSAWIHSGSSLRQALSFLSEFGFETYLIKADGLHQIDYDFWGEYFRYSNFFACRPQDLQVVDTLIRDRI